MRTLYILIVAIVAACPAVAQPRPVEPAKGFISIDGGIQATSNDFAASTTFQQNVEEGRLDSDYTVEGGPALNISGLGRVWRKLGVGVAVTRF